MGASLLGVLRAELFWFEFGYEEMPEFTSVFRCSAIVSMEVETISDSPRFVGDVGFYPLRSPPRRDVPVPSLRVVYAHPE